MLPTLLDKRAVAAVEAMMPADDVFDITPDDEVDLTMLTRAIRVEGEGIVVFVNRWGRTCTARFAAGETRALRASRILATGTTATGIEGIA